MSDITIIDVREPFEYAGGHIEGAINVPVGVLAEGVPPQLAALPMGQEIVVYCQSGSRAAMATELLQRFGFTNVRNGINQAHVRDWLG